MGKSPCSDKSGLKKGPWTAEEDQRLIDYIQKHGIGRWRLLPKNAGLKRCGKSCRLRWTNYLRPDIKRGKFSFEEEEVIIQLHSVLGNKWSAIAARLPGRTDNEIKNYWNTHLKKRLLRMGIDPVTHKPRLDLLQLYSLLNSSLLNPSNLLGIGSMCNPTALNLANSFLPSQGNHNQEIISPKNFQQNQFGSTQVQNQFHCLQAYFTDSTSQVLNETQLTQANSGQLSDNPTNFSCQNSLQNISSWSDIAYCGYHDTNQPFINTLFETLPSLSFSSLLSATPSCSTTPLHSTSNTCVNGTVTEDERDSYCSNMLIFDRPNGLDGNRLM